MGRLSAPRVALTAVHSPGPITIPGSAGLPMSVFVEDMPHSTIYHYFAENFRHSNDQIDGCLEAFLDGFHGSESSFIYVYSLQNRPHESRIYIFKDADVVYPVSFTSDDSLQSSVGVPMEVIAMIQTIFVLKAAPTVTFIMFRATMVVM